MKEDFIQAVWKHRLFDCTSLKSSQGHFIEIIHPGYHQMDSGPDFLASQIRINDVLWAGSVEIHMKNVEWFQHKHHQDVAYNNVILHVVYDDDNTACTTQDGRELICLSLKNLIQPEVLNQYHSLCEDMRVLPCISSWKEMDKELIDQWLTRLCIQRMEEKMQPLKERLRQTNYHWEQVCFEALSKQFGFHVNAEPMERLARSLKVEWFQKNVHHSNFTEAILFGQTGFLERNFTEQYPQMLKKEYKYLSSKFHLKNIDPSTWKFSKLRPLNFPTIRIAQLSATYQQNPVLFRNFIECNTLEEVRKVFYVEINPYWDNHYQFEKPTHQINKKIGESSFQKIALNTLCLLLLAYAEYKNDDVYAERALLFMEQLDPEINRYTKIYNECGFVFANGLQTQGIRKLWESFCDDKKCLNCNVGLNMLKS